MMIMKRRHSEQKRSLEDHLADEARHVREEAKSLPTGVVRQASLQKARHAAIGFRPSKIGGGPFEVDGKGIQARQAAVFRN